MKRNFLLILFFIFCISLVFGQEYKSVPVNPPAMKAFTFQGPSRDNISIIYDQSTPGYQAFPSQYISLTANPPEEPRIQCADDFAVPEGMSWAINAIGVQFLSLEPTSSFDVFFYENQQLPGDAMDGTPGNLIASFTGLSYEISYMNPPYFGYEIFFPGEVLLNAGSYWVSVVARVDNTQFPVPSQNWIESVNPPGGLGSEFYAQAIPFNPVWTPGSVFFSAVPTNLAFALGGSQYEIDSVPLSPLAILGVIFAIAIVISIRSRIFRA